MLTKRCAHRPLTCLCLSTFAARNERELRDWIDGLEKTGVEPAPNDYQVAALVRTIGGGERADRGRSFVRQTREAETACSYSLSRLHVTAPKRTARRQVRTPMVLLAIDLAHQARARSPMQGACDARRARDHQGAAAG